MEWNQETIARLHALWAEGHSTAEIGRRMSVSKNAVVGKAHRLNLPARPSPIRRTGTTSAPRPAMPRRLVGPTLPPLPASLAPELIRTMSLPAELPRAPVPSPSLPANPIQDPRCPANPPRQSQRRFGR